MRVGARTLAAPVLAVGFVLLASCGGGETEIEDGTGESCEPGRSVECTCPDGQTGTEECREDETWGSCACSPDTDTTQSDGGFSDTGAAGDTGEETDRDTGMSGDTGEMDEDEPTDPLKDVRAESPFERDVSLPDCDPSASEVKVIDEASDWQDINSDQYRVFCVEPGDYRGVEPQDQYGRIELTASGSEGARRYIVYDGESDVHPVEQTDDQRAILDGLHFTDGASYWTVAGMKIDTSDVGGARDFPISVRGGADRNTIHRVLADGPDDEFVNSYISRIYGDQTTIQNSVFRNTLQAPDESGRDRYCINIAGSETIGTRIVSNELYNCTDSVQAVDRDDGNNYSGTVIAHNDMYFTPRYYSDGDGNRDPDASGDWTCGENAVDIKTASHDSDRPFKVVGNRMWGYSDADEDCGGSGTGKAANAITIHNSGNEEGATTRFVEVRNNVIFESEGGIGIGWSNQVTVENNLVHKFGFKGADSGFESGPGRGFLTHDAENTTVRGNTFLDGKVWARIASSTRVENNAFVDAGDVDVAEYRVDTDAENNAYYGNSEAWEDNPAIQRGGAEEANNEEFCVTLRGYTEPTEKCFQNAVSTDGSPHGTDVGFVPPNR